MLYRRLQQGQRELFVRTGGERGERPPEQPSNFETIGLEEAARRVALTIDGIGGMAPDALHDFVRIRWERKVRRAKNGASTVVSLAPLAGGRGAVAIRTSSPIIVDEAFAFRFPLKSERATMTPAERQRRHAGDLQRLVTFFVKTHRGASTLLSSAPNACPRCTRSLAPRVAQCRCGQWRTLPKRVSEKTTQTLDTVQSTAVERIVTGAAWDEVWGGGIVPASTSLIAGTPGAGKSTLVLQVASRLAELSGRKILYASIETSVGELRTVAERLQVPLGQIVPVSIFDANDIEVHEFGVPAAVIVDSVSSLVDRDIYAAVDVAKRCKRYGVRYGVAAFLICHMTKEQDFAGLLALQHEVDVLLQLDASEDGLRTLQAIKNRYGPAHVKQCLMMTATGLTPCPPPPTAPSRR